MMEAGLIGCGEMGSAFFAPISKRLSSGMVVSPTKDLSAVPWIAANPRIATSRIAADAFKQCKIVFIAVPPPALIPLLSVNASVIQEARPVIVSMCGTGSIAQMHEAIGSSDVHVIRIMPNTPCEIGRGVTGVTSCHDHPEVMSLIALTGKYTSINEDEIYNFAVAFGCTPAYTYMLLEALSDSAVFLGVPRALADTLAIQNVLDACDKLNHKDFRPDSLQHPIETAYDAGLAAI